MLWFRFGHKGNHSLNKKITFSVCFCRGNAPFWITSVISLAQGKSLWIKKLRFQYVSVGETPLFESQEWFPLHQNRKNNKTQAYVLLHLYLSYLWLRGLGAYLNRQVEVRRLQIIKKVDRAKKSLGKYWGLCIPLRTRI